VSPVDITVCRRSETENPAIGLDPRPVVLEPGHRA